MADDPKTEPIFQVNPENDILTHLHGTEIPGGLITVGSSIATANPPTPVQSDRIIHGIYQFAGRFTKAER
jgi:hypothetical protein